MPTLPLPHLRVPRGAVVAFERIDDSMACHPQELAIAQAAGYRDRRLASFAAGRRAAGRALELLALPRVAVGRGDAGQPLWPHGVVGSISHKRDLAVAIAAPLERFRALGIDLEACDHEPTPAAANRVLTECERTALVGAARPGRWLLELFAAKESLFKAIQPLEGVWFDYMDVSLTRQERGWRARLHRRLAADLEAGHELAVQLDFDSRWIVALCALPAPDRLASDDPPTDQAPAPAST